MMEGFMLNLDTATLFFRTCDLYKVNDPAKRLEVLRKITARKKAVYLRDAEAFLEGKNVLKIKRTGDGE